MPDRKGLQKSRSSGKIPTVPQDVAVQGLNVLHEGWVLKKKRKKMQGYAKRYLILTKEGILTYAMAPNKPARDSIEIPHASVISSKRHGELSCSSVTARHTEPTADSLYSHRDHPR